MPCHRDDPGRRAKSGLRDLRSRLYPPRPEQSHARGWDCSGRRNSSPCCTKPPLTCATRPHTGSRMAIWSKSSLDTAIHPQRRVDVRTTIGQGGDSHRYRHVPREPGGDRRKLGVRRCIGYAPADGYPAVARPATGKYRSIANRGGGQCPRPGSYSGGRRSRTRRRASICSCGVLKPAPMKLTVMWVAPNARQRSR